MVKNEIKIIEMAYSLFYILLAIDKFDVLYYNISNQTVTFVKWGEKLETKGI